LSDKIFDRRSKKEVKDNGQFSLFDILEPKRTVLEESQKKITISAHTRKKRGRKPLQVDIPRVDVIHDLTDDEKKCDCGHEKERIGQKDFMD